MDESECPNTPSNTEAGAEIQLRATSTVTYNNQTLHNILNNKGKVNMIL
jgi:hypothetical protein